MHDYRTLGKGSPPVELPTMVDPISTPERSTPRSIAPASIPAIAESRGSNVLMGSNGQTVDPTINKNRFLTKLQTPSVHQNVTASLHGSRPSISSISSASTTGSSIQSDRFFDIRDSTPFSDSNPTSPEEDASPLAACGAKISSLRIDSDCDALTGDESPLVDRERRRKSSTKSRPGPNPLKLSSNLLVTPQSTFNGTRRPSSALNDTSPTELNSPSVHLTRSLQRLSLNETSDTTPLPRTRSASLRPPQNLNTDQRTRASSASGRIGKSVDNEAEVSSAGKEQEGLSETSMNRSPANAVLPQTVKSNNGSNLRSKNQTRRSSSQASTEELTEAICTLKDSPAPSISSPSIACRNSTTAGRSLQPQRPKPETKIVIKKPVNRRKSSNVHKKPPKITREDSASELEDEGVLVDPKDTKTALPLKSKRRSLPDSRERSIRHSDASDQDVTQPRVAGLGASSTPSHQDDAQSAHESMPEEVVEPAVDGERIRLAFEPYYKDSLSEGDIEAELISMIRRESSKTIKTDAKSGHVYVYTLPSCIKGYKGSTAESDPVYQYFKVGFTKKNTKRRRLKEHQPHHKEKIIAIDDLGRKRFAFAKLVERLVHYEFREHRMKLPCSKPCVNKKGVPRRHGEWFEVEEQRLLDSIEKWRSWMRKSKPYHTGEYYLTPRWQWKLKPLDLETSAKRLNDVLKPFTVWEDLEYRKDWIVEQICVLRTQAQDVISVLSSSMRFFAIFGTAFFLVSTLGLTLGWACFVLVLVISVILYVAPG